MKESLDNTPSATDLRKIRQDLKIVKNVLETKTSLGQKDLEELITLRANVDAIKNYLLLGTPSTTSLKQSMDALKTSMTNIGLGIDEALLGIQKDLNHITCDLEKCLKTDPNTLDPYNQIFETLKNIKQNLTGPNSMQILKTIIESLKNICTGLITTKSHSPDSYNSLMSIFDSLNRIKQNLDSYSAYAVCPTCV